MDTTRKPDQEAAARVISFYLPQFHTIKENDEWWGIGFTEWTNTRRAKPLFEGHRQPREPGELGYYDLTNASARQRQAELAQEHGIEGFCYWHYWFGNGRRILERPFNEVLSSGEPAIPFCLCWANQSWTGVWHGTPGRVLLQQEYPGPEDDQRHFNLLLPAFEDRRYIKVDGKPLFLIYAPLELPDTTDFVNRWQAMAAAAGLPGLYLVAMAVDVDNPRLLPFDRTMAAGPGDYLDNQPRLSLARRLLRRAAASGKANFLPDALRLKLKAPMRFEYSDLVSHAFQWLPPGPRYIPCVIPGWDNTPRSGRRGVVIDGATPTLYRAYLRKALNRVTEVRSSERFVFVKAWNEWAEGNFLEPSSDDGRLYLEATRDEVY